MLSNFNHYCVECNKTHLLSEADKSEVRKELRVMIQDMVAKKREAEHEMAKARELGNVDAVDSRMVEIDKLNKNITQRKAELEKV